MATTYYDTYNGRIFSETTNGVQLDYLHDALGSVVATVDQTAMLVNTYRYKPYGDLLAKTGFAADPKFLWVGAWGYRNTTNVWAEKYVRARHYCVRQTQWTTVDVLWLQTSAYGYVESSPSMKVDPSGLSSCLCSDLLAGVDPKDIAKILPCVSCVRHGNPDELGTCLKKCLKDLSGSVLDKLLAYLGCIAASYGSDFHGKDPCCKGLYTNCYHCCNSKLQKCLYGCWDKKDEATVGVCLENCHGDDNRGYNCCYEKCDPHTECSQRDCK